MSLIHRARWLPVLFLCSALTGNFAVVVAGSSGSPEKKRIRLGDTVPLSMPRVKRVRMSREGIVFIRHGNGDEWHLTGTSRGVVILHPEGEDTPAGTSVPDIVVEVFSSVPRISTSSQTREKEGNPGCDPVKESTGVFEFSVSMDSSREARESGLPLRLDLNGNWISIGGAGVTAASRVSAAVSSADLEGSMDSRVFARPRLVLVPGSEAIARSGGEFRIEAPVVHQQSSHGNPNGLFPGRIDTWKEYGLALKAKWVSCVHKDALLEYEVAVTHRISGSEQHLLAGRISGSRMVGALQPAFGGSVEFATGAKARQGSWILERMPLIGPLFARHENEDGNATMTLWIKAISEIPDGPKGGNSAFKGSGG